MSVTHRARMLCFALTMICCSGCIQTRIVVVRPGEPVQIVEPITAQVRKVGEDGVASQRLDGWYAVEPSVWDALMRRLESR